MSEKRRVVKHPTEKLWAVIAPGRLGRPDETGSVGKKKKREKRKENPFAPGNEQATPREVLRIGEGGPFEPGWQVRVVPNKYPVFEEHEVVILHPKGLDFGEMTDEHAVLVFEAYQERYKALKDKGSFFLYHNVGRAAGASLKHPHSQVMAIPKEIRSSFRRPPRITNIVKETEQLVAFCPEFSQHPYELWILPKGRNGKFGALGKGELSALATLLNHLVGRLKEVLKKPDYNFYLCACESPSQPFGWYLRIFPRLTIWACLELGAGIAVNPVDPREAAKDLKS